MCVHKWDELEKVLSHLGLSESHVLLSQKIYEISWCCGVFLVRIVEKLIFLSITFSEICSQNKWHYPLKLSVWVNCTLLPAFQQSAVYLWGENRHQQQWEYVLISSNATGVFVHLWTVS